MKLISVRQLVQDFDGCFRFYRDIMGLEATWGKEGEAYAAFKSEGTEVLLELFSRKIAATLSGTLNLPAEVASQDRALVSFSVPDVDAAYTEAQSKGAQTAGAPADHTNWGIRAAYLRDPDGNLIEMFKHLEVASE